MSTYAEADRLKNEAFDILERMINLRPVAVGLVLDPSGDYSVKVTLPASPLHELPNELFGVAVRYDVLASRPRYLAGTPHRWKRGVADRPSVDTPDAAETERSKVAGAA